MDEPTSAGIPGSELPGPWPVGVYAARLRERLRGFARVQVIGEVWNLRVSRAKVFWELRDPGGALPCSMWRSDWDALGLGELADGARVVAGGGADFYPGSATSSPSFTFGCSELRVAGEGDLLAQVDRLRRTLAAEGLLDRQAGLRRPVPPRTIGVVTGEGGKARDDIRAGLERQGWAGRLVWAWAPVQDRHAAPRIAQALRDLVALARPDVIVVARGGGSLADLLAFCDEGLCRTVALLPVPVLASVGHHTDRTLIDDVAAEACSTPTHAAQVAVGVDCAAARSAMRAAASRLEVHGRRAVVERARALARLSRSPATALARHRVRLHQQARELRAAARRRVAAERGQTARRAIVVERKTRAGGPEHERVRLALDARRAALAAHDPERVLARGYALVEDPAGAPLTGVEEARAVRDLRVRFGDGAVRARVQDAETP